MTLTAIIKHIFWHREPKPSPPTPVETIQAARRAAMERAHAIRNRPGSQVALHKVQALTTAELEAGRGA